MAKPKILATGNGLLHVTMKEDGKKAELRFWPDDDADDVDEMILGQAVKGITGNSRGNLTIDYKTPYRIEITQLQDAIPGYKKLGDLAEAIAHEAQKAYSQGMHNFTVNDQGIKQDITCRTYLEGDKIILHIGPYGPNGPEESHSSSLAVDLSKMHGEHIDVPKMSMALLNKISPHLMKHLTPWDDEARGFPITPVNAVGIKYITAGNPEDLGVFVTLDCYNHIEANRVLKELRRSMDKLAKKEITAPGEHAQKVKAKPIDAATLFESIDNIIMGPAGETNPAGGTNPLDMAKAEKLKALLRTHGITPPDKGAGRQ